MRKITLFVIVVFIGFSSPSFAFYSKEYTAFFVSSKELFSQEQEFPSSVIVVNQQLINAFFKKYSNFQIYQSKVTSLYACRKFNSIWFNTNCELIPFAKLLYAKANSLDEEAVDGCLDYKESIDGIFSPNTELNLLSYNETEILLSTLYVYYVQKVFDDFNAIQLQKMGWNLQKKELDYSDFLDALLENPKRLDFDEKHQFYQYYKLRSALKKYREIEKKGEWNNIEYDSTIQNYKPYDSCRTISQIRHRLYIMGDLEQDTKSELYDPVLMNAVLRYKKRMGYYPNYFISPQQIKQLNLPIRDYIKKLMVNMERCRWVDPELTNSSEYIKVNIPAFELVYVKNSNQLLESKVVVGQDMMPTAIFSGCVSTIVFSPYWYVPQSIIDSEIKSSMSRDKNYLESRDMEWNNGDVRQRPGPKNSMGLVKFLFPNSNDIYLHDTPSKALFNLDYRAYSHGCINLQKSRELAHAVLKDDPDWPEDCIDWAMNRKEESVCVLKQEIPIHLVYFTAWVDAYNILHFYDDLYGQDAQLEALLFHN